MKNRWFSLPTDSPGPRARRALPLLALAILAGVNAAQAAAQKVELEGTLEVLVEDRPNHARTRYFLATASGPIELRIADIADRLASGAKIRVSGKHAGNAIVVRSIAYLAQSPQTGSTSMSMLPNTLGEQRTLVMLVNFQENPTEEPFTVNQVKQAVFGIASDFFGENSYGQTWLAGDVTPWTTIPITSTSCDQLGIAREASLAASAAGLDPSSYARHVYLFPRNATCGWDGTSTVGGSPSRTWINGRIDLSILGHELGHALGLEHSLSLSCNGSTLGTDCTTLEYGDGVDLMGWSPQAHFNAFQKEKLGWLGDAASPAILTVEKTGTYQIGSLEFAGNIPMVLKIPQSVDPTSGWITWYYVELRDAVGFDSILTSSTSMMDEMNILGGVLIHTGPDMYRNTSYLLDMTPETYDLYTRDPALTVGRSFSDPQAAIAITAEAVGDGTASVRVTMDSSDPATPAAVLEVSVSTSQASYTPLQPVPISALVKADGSAVADASVKFTVTKPNGAIVTQTKSSDTQGRATYTLRIKRNDPLGTYQVHADAVKGASVGSASGSFVVNR